MNKIIITLTISLCTLAASSQKNAVKSNYYKDYLKAIDFIDNEKFEDAQDLLEDIPEQDSLFLKAQYRLQLVYSRSENYPKVAEIGKIMAELPFAAGNRVYNTWAHSLSKMEKHEQALAVVEEGLEKFSESHLLYYRKGLILQDLKRHQEAMYAFQRAIQAYPLHVYSHVKLGEMAAHEGRQTQALLSLTFATIFEDDLEYKSYIHGLMEEISTSDFESEPKGLIFDDGDVFNGIDKIIQTKISLSSKFKLKSKIKQVAYTRQLQVIFESLIYDEKADGFWMQHYVPLYTAIYDGKLFDALTYVSLIGPDYGKASAPAIKGRKRIAAFFKWLIPNVGPYIARQYIEFDGEKQIAYIDLGDQNITGRGIGQSHEDRNGNWELFDGNNGRSVGIGPYNNGKRDGEWIIYDEISGFLSRKLTFVDGELNGLLTYYYENGSPEIVVNMKSGERNGKRLIFYPSGDTMLIDYHIMGKRTGEFIKFHENNTLKLKGNLVDDKWEGEVREYHTNGELSAIINFKNDERNGTYTFYFRNGKISEKGNYLLAKKIDAYESFYNNGQIASKGNYKNDIQIGSWVSYYYDGKLKEEAEFDENGKKNAIQKTYDRDGKLHYEMEFKAGELQAFKFYDKSGKIIAQEKRSGKKISFKFYDPRGVLTTQGQFDDDLKTGKWLYFNENGIKQTEHTYEKGKINGKSTTYFANGETEVLENYVDDEMSGLVLAYHPNGELKTEGYYSEGSRTGMWYFYYLDGSLSDREYYVEGEITGWSDDYSSKGILYRRHYNRDGDIQKTIHFDLVGNSLDTVHYYHGEVLIPNPNGKDILAKQHYKNDVRHGLSESYFLGNKISSSVEFFNGRRNGLFIDYYPNGQKSSEVTYVHGMKNGQQIDYRWNGKIATKTEYKDDILDGESFNYHPDGSLHYKMTYVNDEAEGEVRMMLPSGEVYAIFYYESAILIAYSYLDKSGNVKERIPLVNDGQIVCYYKNGTKSLETNLTFGEYHGSYTVYDIKGKVFEQKSYVYGNIDGLASFNSSSERIYNTTTYSLGYRHGEMKLYHLNGKIFTECNYYFGNKNGIEKEYDQNGKLVVTREYYNGVVISEKK